MNTSIKSIPLELPQDQFTSVKGVRTRYWSEGEKGTAVILIHGLGGFAENWMYNIKPLGQAHRVFVLDLLGFGQTDKTPLVRDLNVLVRFINNFMAALQIPKASLIGNSLGGGLALQFTLDYPAKVEKLVLADNAGMGREVCSDFRFCVLPMVYSVFSRSDRKGAGILEQLVYDASVITPEFRELSNKYVTAEGAAKALMSALRSGINLLGQKGKLTRQLRERLGSISAPTLVVWGKQDRIIPVSHAHIAAENIPGARLELFDNCGHMPMFEQPEQFNKLVLDFLDGKGAAA